MNKKYWYVVSGNIEDVNQELTRKGIFHVWGAIVPGDPAAASHSYLVCIDWAGFELQDKLNFEALANVTSLPHPASTAKSKIDPACMRLLKVCTGNSGQHAIQDGDGTHDIVEKLTGHTGWNGWWKHL